MAEYIEREMALKAIDEYFHTTNPDGEEQIGVLKSRRIIRTLPAADVEVVKHGRWERTADGAARCTACKRKMNPSQYGYPRCSLCGAHMDLEVDNGLDQH